MAVPKRKVSSARQNKRRSNVWKLQAPLFYKRCPQCGEYKTPHRVLRQLRLHNGPCRCEEGRLNFSCKRREKGTRAKRPLLYFTGRF